MRTTAETLPPHRYRRDPPCTRSLAAAADSSSRCPPSPPSPPAHAGTFDVLACDAALQRLGPVMDLRHQRPGHRRAGELPDTRNRALGDGSLHRRRQRAGLLDRSVRALVVRRAGRCHRRRRQHRLLGGAQGPELVVGALGRRATPLQGCNYGDAPYNCSWERRPGPRRGSPPAARAASATPSAASTAAGAATIG